VIPPHNAPPPGPPPTAAAVDDDILDPLPTPVRPSSRPRNEDDRPRPKSRRDEDEDEDNDNGGRKRDRRITGESSSNAPALRLIGCVVTLLIVFCGGGAYGLYLLYKAGKDKVEEITREMDRANARVTQGNAERVQTGRATLAEAESVLGPGKPATVEEVKRVFPGAGQFSQDRIAEWTPKADQGRVLYWQNGDDIVIAAFHPDLAPAARLQMKAYSFRGGTSTGHAGEPNDEKFLKDNPPGDADAGPPVEVTAEELAKAYKDDPAAADAKYKGRLVAVEGKLHDIMITGDVMVLLAGLPPEPGQPLGTKVRCLPTKAEERRVWNASRGQTIKLKGKCAGMSGPFIDVMDCKVERMGSDPAVQLRASALVLEHAKDADGTDRKYQDKAVTLTDALVESKEAAALVVVSTSKKGPPVKIKATLPADYVKQLAGVKVGDRVTIKGEYSSSSDGTIYLNRCWVVP
jgi:hypothetical protein